MVHAPSEPDRFPIADVRRQVTARLHELETALVAHGLVVVEVDAMLWRLEVRAPATALAAGCTRHIQLAPDPVVPLSLSWHLVVPHPRDGVSDTEPLGAEGDITEVVEQIAQALTRSGEA